MNQPVSAKDYFIDTEILMMAEGFGQKSVFGIHSKSRVLIEDTEWEAAWNRLKEKGILNNQNQISEEGSHVISSLEQYCASETYARLHNLTFERPTENMPAVTMLAEQRDSERYRVYRMTYLALLHFLFEKFPILTRTPSSEEQEFTLMKLGQEKRALLQKIEKKEQEMSLEIFDKSEVAISANPYKRITFWSVFVYDGELVAVDNIKSEYYKASQYWFNKLVCDILKIPYEERRVINARRNIAKPY
ncbi:DUF5081 family protein [Listeria booriae]|uniref:DUF5081 family protein n=1 Tax=Listeria booriae TaxID=1552123 RepID=UPI00162ACBD3|nr:DUF5081 family protein [Listeria booriae]MBC1524291.1 DUF5081 family protein [Listeria booriae]MBC6135250.1 DUF5081 family protein [Listeria booriae]